MTNKVGCNVVEQWIYLALDGELSEDLRAPLEAHLDSCADCRARSQAAAEEQSLLARELGAMSSAVDHSLEGKLDAGQITDLATYGDAATRKARSRTALRLRVAAAALLLCGAGLLAWGIQAWREVEIGTLAWNSAGIEVRASGGATAALAAAGSRPLMLGDEVRLPTGVDARLTLDDGAAVELLGPGSFEISRDPAGTRLEMDSGWCQIALERSAGGGFAVATPVAEARVAGTEFTVEHRPGAARTTVEVARGEVLVELLQQGAAPVRLRAGEMCRVFRAEIQSGVWKKKDGSEQWEWQRRPSARWLVEKEPLDLPAPDVGEEQGAAQDEFGAPRVPSGPAPDAPPAGREPRNGAPLDMPRKR